jgi:hypothetical protein
MMWKTHPFLATRHPDSEERKRSGFTTARTAYRVVEVDSVETATKWTY